MPFVDFFYEMSSVNVPLHKIKWIKSGYIISTTSNVLYIHKDPWCTFTYARPVLDPCSCRIQQKAKFGDSKLSDSCSILSSITYNINIQTKILVRRSRTREVSVMSDKVCNNSGSGPAYPSIFSTELKVWSLKQLIQCKLKGNPSSFKGKDHCFRNRDVTLE